MLEKPNVSEKDLRFYLQEHYDLIPASLEILPLGLDTAATVYRVVSEQGTAYFLKIKSGPLYQPTCLVPAYLRDQGIASVVAPLPTKRSTLWVQVEKWTMILYPFIEGDTSWTGMTDEQWKEVGSSFKRIHQVTLPPEGFESLRKESFDPTEYTRWIRTFEAQHLPQRRQTSNGGSAAERALLSSWIEHQSTIHEVVIAMEKLAEVLQRRTLPYVICHADLHPANLLRAPSGHVFVIDWDDVMLAPRERDFIFVGDPPVDDSAQQAIPPFFQGYGETKVDWVALTYYCYERVIQDVVSFAQEICFREDLGEEFKADGTQLFHAMLSEGGEIDAARSAARHLPPELDVHN
jgi:spectinomycin phosphotransferase